MLKISENAKANRLSLELTQQGLATRSGVSLSSIKRFESSGQISLQSLLKIALVLNALEDFLLVFQTKGKKINSLSDLTKITKKTRKRGKKK